MFLVLVIHRFVLDFTALVTGFHGTQHAAPFRNPLELGQYGFFQQFGQLFHDKASLVRVFVHGQSPFLVDNQLDCQCPTHRFIGRCGDGFVERIGVQAIAVVVDGIQRL